MSEREHRPTAGGSGKKPGREPGAMGFARQQFPYFLGKALGKLPEVFSASLSVKWVKAHMPQGEKIRGDRVCESSHVPCVLV